MNSSLKLIFWFADTRFFNKQHFYSQHQAEIDKNSGISPAKP